MRKESKQPARTLHRPAGEENSRREGFTIIELLISSALFVILIALTSGSFIQTLRTQRVVTNLSESMNDTSFVIEQMSREIRTGFSFNAGGNTLRFTNADGDQVSYKLIGAGIGRCVGGCGSNSGFDILTAPAVAIDNLEFRAQGIAAGDGEPPRITILLSVVSEKDIKVNLQTTISSRILDT